METGRRLGDDCRGFLRIRPQRAGQGSISLLVPGNLAAGYYDSSGRRIAGKIVKPQTPLKIVYDESALIGCKKNPRMNSSYYEGDCVMVQPKVPGISTKAVVIDPPGDWTGPLDDLTRSDIEDR